MDPRAAKHPGVIGWPHFPPLQWQFPQTLVDDDGAVLEPLVRTDVLPCLSCAFAWLATMMNTALSAPAQEVQSCPTTTFWGSSLLKSLLIARGGGDLRDGSLECARKCGCDDVDSATCFLWLRELLQAAKAALPSGHVQNSSYLGPLRLLALQHLESLTKGLISGFSHIGRPWHDLNAIRKEGFPYVAILERAIRIEMQWVLPELEHLATSALRAFLECSAIVVRRDS
ncbi:hypothetical protein VaNZ11_008449 [Volvox africanus]|uniref:Uncharacterized protein n=1 Tax=Volvox africanus TaxID=51714 RepID=A0ABQ5S5S8_9CHLO|nr:hypothetical protein VaNZ11_008449 [Volvox africanus]